MQLTFYGFRAFSTSKLSSSKVFTQRALSVNVQIKPDGVQRGLIADIIKRFESKGYKLVGIKVRAAGICS